MQLNDSIPAHCFGHGLGACRLCGERFDISEDDVRAAMAESVQCYGIECTAEEACNNIEICRRCAGIDG